MRLAVYLSLAIAAVSADPQPMQMPLGSRIPRPPHWESVEQEKAAKIRSAFLKCTYGKNPGKVEALLAASDPMMWDMKKLGVSRRNFNRTFALEACLSKAGEALEGFGLVQLTMKFESFRAMMAEASYLAHNPSPAPWLKTVPSAVVRASVSEGDDLRLATAKAMFADCLVAAAPQFSDELLRTPPNSSTEKPAIKALVPFLGPCVPAGQTLSFSAESLRRFAADGLWTAWRSVQEAAK